MEILFVVPSIIHRSFILSLPPYKAFNRQLIVCELANTQEEGERAKAGLAKKSK